MRHNVAGKSLGRNTAHRAALRKNFTVSLIKHERVITTLPKAKALRPFVEKMITLARSGDKATRLHRIRRAVSFLQDKDAVRKRAENAGFEITPSSPQAVRERMQADSAMVLPLIAAGRIARH